jgi:hypothetical protein
MSSATIVGTVLLAGCQSESGQWRWPWESASTDQQSTLADQRQPTYQSAPRDTTYDAARTAGGTAAPSQAELTTQANQLLDQTQQYIRDGNYSMADQTLKTLNQIKPQLPAAYQSRIDSAQSMLNTARQGQGMLGR